MHATAKSINPRYSLIPKTTIILTIWKFPVMSENRVILVWLVGCILLNVQKNFSRMETSSLPAKNCKMTAFPRGLAVMPAFAQGLGSCGLVLKAAPFYSLCT